MDTEELLSYGSLRDLMECLISHIDVHSDGVAYMVPSDNVVSLLAVELEWFESNLPGLVSHAI